VNPALQGYLVAMEESLGADGALASAADELRAVPTWSTGATN